MARKRPPTVAAAASRAPARGPAPFGLLAAGRALCAWAWEHTALSAAAVALALAFMAILLQPSDAAQATRALSSRAHFAMPQMEQFVERSVIVHAIACNKSARHLRTRNPTPPKRPTQT